MFTVDDIQSIIKLEDIENAVSEYDIFKAYIPHFKEIDRDFKSEFYDDHKPDCRVYPSGTGKLLYHDFGNGDHFNCYTYVMKKYSCTFAECLRIIANDFNLLKVKSSVSFKPNFILGKESITKKTFEPRVRSEISIVSRNWNLTDYNYWFKQYGLSFEWCESYFITPCSHVYLKRFDSTVTYVSTKSNPIYAYKEFDWETGDFLGYKIYFPLNLDKKRKWICAADIGKSIAGWEQLPETDDIGILTKSRKDAAVLRTLGFSGYSLQGEANNLPSKLMPILESRFTHNFILYDNDKGGIDGAESMSSKYPFKTIFIPIKYDCKDASELVAKIGQNEAKTVLNKLINNLK